MILPSYSLPPTFKFHGCKGQNSQKSWTPTQIIHLFWNHEPGFLALVMGLHILIKSNIINSFENILFMWTKSNRQALTFSKNIMKHLWKQILNMYIYVELNQADTNLSIVCHVYGLKYYFLSCSRRINLISSFQYITYFCS